MEHIQQGSIQILNLFTGQIAKFKWDAHVDCGDLSTRWWLGSKPSGCLTRTWEAGSRKKFRQMEAKGESRRIQASQSAKKGWQMKSRGSKIVLKITTIIIFSTHRPTTSLNRTSTPNLLKWTTNWVCLHSISTIPTESTHSCFNRWLLRKISTCQWCPISTQMVSCLTSSSSQRPNSHLCTNQIFSITPKTSVTSPPLKPTVTPLQSIFQLLETPHSKVQARKDAKLTMVKEKLTRWKRKSSRKLMTRLKSVR